MSDNPYRAVFEAWRDDPDFRTRIEHDPKAALAAKGIDLPCDEVRVAVDTPQTCHIVFPPDPNAIPNATLSDEALEAVAGGRHGVWDEYYRQYGWQYGGHWRDSWLGW